MVEFALVIPILLVLFVAVADFGRIFANSILLEAAARNGAELVANEYLANPPGGAPLSGPAPSPDPSYYANLHLLGARAICAETSELPNSNYSSGTADCPGMPFIEVCVHDDQDPSCGAEVYASAIPASCNQMSNSTMTNSRGGSTERWVEVRVCYKFTSLLDLPLVSFGTFWLERTRSFAIPCYFVMDSQPCG